MNRLVYAIALVALVFSGACSNNNSPTTPTPTPVTTPTRIINVSGKLAFGNVNVGATADRQFTISNSGNATLTFTSLQAVGGSGIAGYSASPTSGTVSPGSSVSVNLHFAPTAAQFYSNVLTVAGDQTSGNAAINVSGTGVSVAPPPPPFTMSGTGASVFDMPSTVTRVRIFGDYGGSCENFIIQIAGRLVVNEILGSCSVATSGRHFDGTFLTSGGVVQVLNSSGISWTFVQVN